MGKSLLGAQTTGTLPTHPLSISYKEVLGWLQETRSDRLAELWRLADQTRQHYVGNQVHLRGLIEISNYCIRSCWYCGLRSQRRDLPRYRLSEESVMACVQEAARRGYGTVVLQSGEDPGLSAAWVAKIVRRIKSETPLAVTLSLGERAEQELVQWRQAGADRYFLRFETSNPVLFRQFHPPRSENNFQVALESSVHPRLQLLTRLQALGYEVGSGILIGLPGQTYEDLAEDILCFARMDFDMIGVGPYLVHPATPLADRTTWPPTAPDRQVPASAEITYKVIALSRLVCPKANIPATTALGVQGGLEGWRLGLQRGANVLMPNLTPPEYRGLYEIYPNKGQPIPDQDRIPQEEAFTAFLQSLGRAPGCGRGDSPRYLENRPTRIDLLPEEKIDGLQ